MIKSSHKIVIIVRDIISLVLFIGIVLKDSLRAVFAILKPSQYGRRKDSSYKTVLVYHSVSGMDKKADPLKLNIDTELFERQMSYLAKLSEKSNILVTFDDGFENFFSDAFRVILKYNIETLLAVTSDFIDGKISFDDLFSGGQRLAPLNWEKLRKIQDAGIEIGSHTLTHPNLPDLEDERALFEIKESKKRIQEQLGRKVRSFAYPYGSRKAFNQRIKQLVHNAGYSSAYTNIMGFNQGKSDPYELRRIRIYGDDNMFRFRMKLRGAYNWVDCWRQ